MEGRSVNKEMPTLAKFLTWLRCNWSTLGLHGMCCLPAGTPSKLEPVWNAPGMRSEHGSNTFQMHSEHIFVSLFLSSTVGMYPLISKYGLDRVTCCPEAGNVKLKI